MEDIKYKRTKASQESPEKSSRNDHDEQKSKSNSSHGKDGEEKYETKVSSSSGKLLNPCIVAWTICWVLNTHSEIFGYINNL